MMGQHGKQNDDFLDRQLKALLEQHRFHIDVESATAKIMARLAEEKKRTVTQVNQQPLWSWRWAGVTAAAVVVTVIGILLFDSSWNPVSDDVKEYESLITNVVETPLPTAVPGSEVLEPAIVSTAISAPSPPETPLHVVQAEVMSLSGQVLGAGGMPVSATVSYQSTRDHSLSGTMVSLDGTFQFKDIPQDVYTVTAFTDDALADRTTIDRTAADISLALAEKGALTVNLKPGNFSSQAETSDFMANFTVSLQSAPGNPNLIAMESVANGRGEAVFSELPKGSYIISARYDSITDERFTVKTTANTFYKQESVEIPISTSVAAPLETIQRWQSLPAGLAIAATYTCDYQHPPLGNREFVQHIAHIRYQDPKSIYYGLCTEEEIKQWINTVSQPYQENFTVGLTWTAGAYGFEILRGPNNLPAMYNREYVGGDGQRRVHWFSLKNVHAFYVNNLEIKGHYYYLPYYYPNFQLVLAPLSLYSPEAFQMTRIEQDNQYWHYSVIADSEQEIMVSANIKSVLSDSDHVVSMMRYSLQYTQAENKGVEIYLDHYRDFAGDIKLPQHITWLTRNIPKSSSTAELNLANRLNPETDIRMELHWLEGRCGPLSELFPDTTILPKVPEHCMIDDMRYPKSSDASNRSIPDGDYRFTGP